MNRMLLVGYYFGVRSERRLCEEVHLNLAYRWFCRLGLDAPVPDHSPRQLLRFLIAKWGRGLGSQSRSVAIYSPPFFSSSAGRLIPTELLFLRPPLLPPKRLQGSSSFAEQTAPFASIRLGPLLRETSLYPLGKVTKSP